MIKLNCINLLLFVATSVNAQVDTVRTEANYRRDEMVEVKPKELPEPVRDALRRDNYKYFTVTKAWRNYTEDLFRVELSDGVERKSFYFDRNGRPVNDPDLRRR